MWTPLRAALVLAGVFIGLPVVIFVVSSITSEPSCTTQITEIPYPREMLRGVKPNEIDVSISRKTCNAGDSAYRITQVALREKSVMTLGFPKKKPDFATDTFFEFHGHSAVVPRWSDWKSLVIEHAASSTDIRRQAVIWNGVSVDYQVKMPE